MANDKVRPKDSKASVKNAPAEKITVTGLMTDLERRGYREHFKVENGELRGLEGGQVFPPAEVSIRHHYRFEGVSDPDDMSIVYAIETDNGVRGTLTDAFGTYADPEIGTFITAAKDLPSADE